ncbi:unnamed protein product, partial [Mesorhabditis belari]|uniref:Uncharacterized protein n=1 Tax=Mesorhabditis belari TaxID=2138241 RepID=A0AAF3J8S0_9BILA
MEIYWSPSNYTKAGIDQGVYGIITILPAFPPFLFLLYIQFTKKELFSAYKYSVFATSYICFSAHMVNLMSFIWLYYAATVQPPTIALLCYFGKSFGYFLSQYSYCYLLVLALYRFCTIVLHFELPIWALIPLFLGAYSRVLIHIICALFFGEIGYNDSCNPILTTNFLGGYMTVHLWLIGCDLVASVLNAGILLHLRLHYKQLKGKSQSLAQQKARRNLQIGLLISSIWPVLTQSFTAWQITAALLSK